MKVKNTTVYLLRHGAYENPKQVLHLRLPGFPLSPEGKKQAQALGKALASQTITAIYASPLTRAQQTARAIALHHNLPVMTDERIIDIRSPLQGMSLSELKKQGFHPYQHKFIQEGGERLSEVFSRIHKSIQEKVHMHRGQKIVMVSHGDLIMSIVIKYRGGMLYSRNIFERNYVGVGKGYVLEFSDRGRVAIASFP